MTQPKYRQAWYERAKEKRIVARIARLKAAKKNPDVLIKANNHVVPRRHCEVTCEACPTVFIFTMTSKPHRFCPACKIRRARLYRHHRSR